MLCDKFSPKVKSFGMSDAATDGAIPQALSQLVGLMESKEKELKKREEELERRIYVFREEFPDAGTGSDVLHLNVGGDTNIAVLPRTLTQFENSMLAIKFSGRWDDSLEKDRDNNFFIDEDPQVFLQLLIYLRKCDKRKRSDIFVPPPPASFEFCWLLEYYDMVFAIYPQEWNCRWGEGSRTLKPSRPGDPYVIESGSDLCAYQLDLCRRGGRKPTYASEYTIEIERGSTAQNWLGG